MPRDGMLATTRNMRALDLLNFFVADVQTGFGPFIAVYLTANKWTELEIGLVLTVGTVTAIISQVPGGAIVDALHNKRGAVAFGILSVIGAALLFAIWPTRLPVLAAEVLHGFASCILAPAIAAVSLRLVGHAELGERLGRNARYASIGNGMAAAVMGVVGSTLPSQSVFYLTAALGVPALIALCFIQPLHSPHRSLPIHRADMPALKPLLTDRRMLIFMACAMLFHLSNAAMLPLAAAEVTKLAGSTANLIIAACIVVPQMTVALMSPWIGRAAMERGRRPMLLLGWAALPLRGLMLAVLPGPYLLVAGQAVSGVSAAVFGVMLPLIAADLTRGMGRFNLCMGLFGVAVSAGAAMSTTLGGWIAESAGANIAFFALSFAGAAGTFLVWRAMPETRGW